MRLQRRVGWLVGAVDCAFSSVGELAAQLETRLQGQAVCIDDTNLPRWRKPVVKSVWGLNFWLNKHVHNYQLQFRFVWAIIWTGWPQGCLIASAFLAASSEVTCFVACLDVDVGSVDLPVALTLGELFRQWFFEFWTTFRKAFWYWYSLVRTCLLLLHCHWCVIASWKSWR